MVQLTGRESKPLMKNLKKKLPLFFDFYTKIQY